MKVQSWQTQQIDLNSVTETKERVRRSKQPELIGWMFVDRTHKQNTQNQNQNVKGAL